MTLKTTLFTSLDNRVDASNDWQFPWFDEEYFGVLSAMWGQAQALLVGAISFGGYEQTTDTAASTVSQTVLGSLTALSAFRSKIGSLLLMVTMLFGISGLVIGAFFTVCRRRVNTDPEATFES